MHSGLGAGYGAWCKAVKACQQKVAVQLYRHKRDADRHAHTMYVPRQRCHAGLAAPAAVQCSYLFASIQFQVECKQAGARAR